MMMFFDLTDDWGPEKVVTIHDRRLGYQGALVLDNTARGMGKGGTRMSPTVQVEDVMRLARVMTWKWAAVDLFYGGAKAGIRADPTRPDKEAVVRSFARRLSDHVPHEYVFGLDMGLTENDAAVINDELGTRGAAVGTPYELGGVPYDQLGITGFGVAEAADEAARRLGLQGTRVAIQGFGAVGQAAAQRMDALGYSVVAVSTAEGSLADVKGMDVATLVEHRRRAGDGFISDFPEYLVPHGSELFTEAEILIPAAVENVLDSSNVDRIRAVLVVEAANLPVETHAQQMLFEQGVTVVPDFLANAGGVIGAAYAMDARHSPFRLDPEAIFEKVREKLRTNVAACLDMSQESGITPHEAGRTAARGRILSAMRIRDGKSE